MASDTDIATPEPGSRRIGPATLASRLTATLGRLLATLRRPARPAVERERPSLLRRRRRQSRGYSPLTRRILLLNIVPVALLALGAVYLSDYEDELIDAELASLQVQGEMVAAGIGEVAVAGGETTVNRLDADAARKSAMVELAGELNRDPPIYPKQAGTDLSNNTGGFFPAIRSARNTWRNKGDYHTTASSLLEIELGQIATSVAGNNLKPRTYVAIVDHPPDVIVGMEGLIETQSLHVIFGVW